MSIEHDDGRRYLIATAVAHHRHAPQWDRPGLQQARQEMVDLFTGSMGYTHVSDLGMDPTRDQLTAGLRAFCRSPQRRPNDLLVVYIACHGEILDGSGDHVLLTCDTDPDDIADALPTADLARKMLLDTSVRRVLLMLDTCYSGQGGQELAAAALTGMTRHWQDEIGCALVVITSAQPTEQAHTGAFPRLLRQAVDDLSNAGLTPSTLPLDSVIKSINTNPERPGFQTVTSTLAQLTGAIPPFLPNPRHDPRMTEVDLAIQQASEWDAQDEQRDIEYRTRLLVRAMGGHHPDQGWWFSGRHDALIDLTYWLTHPDPARPMLAVTAGPGSGKTAVLGLVATLTHPERRRTVPLDALGLPHAAVPPADSVDVVVYAQNLTTDQVLQAIVAAIRVRADTPGELLEALTGRDAPLTVLIDALDEAAHPDELTRRLLHPLAEHARGQLRLLVGTRPHLLPHLELQRQHSIDLDAARYADLDALTTYAARGLISSHPDSPYPGQSPALIRAVARAVAQTSDPSFLVARITSSTLAAAPDIPDPADPVWRRSLPRLPGPAMHKDLHTRLGQHADRARDLLRPLAFAEGQGLPWEDIWALLASRIAGQPYSDQDVMWLRQAAGSYVVEATEADRSAYRLYHQALAEHLREGLDEHAVHRAFVHVLLSRVPVTADGTRDWAHAHPYTLRHLATHAERCDLLDDVITDANYLVYAHPDELLTVLHSVTTDEARLICAVYRASAAVHRHLTTNARRQILATDAARFNAPLHQVLAQPLRWAPRWATGQQTSTALHSALTGHEFGIWAVACSVIDGQPVAVTGGIDRTVRVWDLTNREQLLTLLTGHEGELGSLACSVIDGQPVAVTTSVRLVDDEVLGAVLVWDLTSGEQLFALTGHEGAVWAVACSVIDGQPVAVTGGTDGTVRVWDLANGEQLLTLTGHEGERGSVACSVIDGQPVAVTLDRGAVRVWDLTNGEQILTLLTGHEVGSVACSVIDGQPVAVVTTRDGLYDIPGAVLVWDLTSGEQLFTLTGHEGAVWAVACSVIDGQPVAVTGGTDGTVRVWDLANGEQLLTLTGHEDGVWAVACSVIDGQPVAVTGGSVDGTVRVWTLEASTNQDNDIRAHTADIRDVACSEVDGRCVAVTGGRDSTVRVWDLTNGEQLFTLTGHEGGVWAVACSVIDGQPVAVTGGTDGTVRVSDLSNGEQLFTLTGHEFGIWAVACSVIDGQPVAVTSDARLVDVDDDEVLGTVRVWDLTNGEQLFTLTGHEGAARAVACSVIDGQPVAVTGGTDGTVRVWDLTNGEQLFILTGHEAGQMNVACSVIDGGPVALTSAIDDDMVRVWDLTNGEQLFTLTGHEGGVGAVACSVIDGRPVAVTGGSVDGTVRVWDLTNGTEVQDLTYARSTANGTLCIGPGREIIMTIGWDLVVTDWRSNK
ncbi:caspase family protein [Lentzea sp. NPDC034063]|uniref:caspase family protein n=1 Tax=unclassified Lentzea TaxID=2643253 RepID=UPI0033DCA32C